MPRTKERYSHEEGLRKDGTKRLPICFCLDTSGSMQTNLSKGSKRTGKSIFVDGKQYRVVEEGVSAMSELKRGMRIFLNNLEKDKMDAYAAEVSIVTFDDYARSILDYSRIADIPSDIIDDISTRDNTYMGEGINMALDKLEDCIAEYHRYNIDYYSPWLVVMSDGKPNGSDYELQAAKMRIQGLQKRENLIVIPVGIGKYADKQTLSDLAKGEEVTSIFEIDFEKLFQTMSNTVHNESKLMGGTVVRPNINKYMKEDNFEDDNHMSDTKENLMIGEYFVFNDWE